MEEQVGSITGHEGAMFVGKSSALMAVAHKAIRKNRRVHVMRSVNETRDQVLGLANHDGQQLLQSSLLTHAKYDQPPRADKLINAGIKVLIVEEAQFFGKDLEELTHLLDYLAFYHSMEIHATFLNATFARKPFPGLAELRSICDKVIHYQGECKFCPKPGSFSLALGDMEGVTFKPGGDEAYALVCRGCFLKHSKNPAQDK